MRPQRTALLVWAGLGALVVAASYLLMIRLHIGQRLDFSAFEGRKWTPLLVRRRISLGVRWATPATVLAVAIGSTVIAAVRRGPIAAVAAATCAPAVLVASRLLRSGLDRDDLLPGSWVSTHNTFPSGHLAVLAATLLVAVAASPPRWRQPVTVGAVIVGGLQVLGVAGSGWHRPSDLLGALGLAVAGGGVSSAVIAGRWRAGTELLSGGWTPTVPGVLIWAAALVGATASWFVFLRLLGGRSYGSFTLHVVGVQGLVMAAFVMVVVHAALVAAADRSLDRS